MHYNAVISLLSGVSDNELSLNSSTSSAFTWKKGQLSKHTNIEKNSNPNNNEIYEILLNSTSSGFIWKKEDNFLNIMKI